VSGELPAASAFQGVIPAMIATCGADGIPNVTYLSQVHRIDAQHVALSCQFFNKTKRNVLENPYASVQLYDPVSFDAYQLSLRYDHAETSGALFDTMSLRIQAIASHTGMAGVFKLLSADVYEILACEKLSGFMLPPPADDLRALAASADACELSRPGVARSELRGLQLISQRTCKAQDLDGLLSSVLDTLAEVFGFEHAMLLMPDESGERLFAVAARGYGDDGIGAEVVVGEGLIGSVARERRMLRLAGVEAELRYGRAIRARALQITGRRALLPEIPLPGLPDAQSHMAMPLSVADRLIGVLAVESRQPLAFDDWDEAFLEIVTNQVAVAIDNMLLRAAHDEEAPQAVAPPAPAVAAGPVLRIRFFESDDCVFVGDEYLVRNVPGRILWKLLRAHVETGRSEFSNRELRLDASLGLPALRDNLESRLVLLRKRLEQKCPELRMVSTSRGHFRLEASCRIELEDCESLPNPRR
jgi:adenylate cyclase